MTQDLATRRAAEARALSVALAVAAKAGWRFEAAGPVLSTPFAGYLYVASAELLLVPTSAALPFATRLVEQATREARSDALIVSCTGTEIGMALGLWSAADTRWTVPVRTWLEGDGALWLVPDRGDAAWRLRPGRVVAAATSPWCTPQERRDGERRTAGWLTGLLA